MTQTVPLIRWFTPIERAYEKDGVSLEELWPVLGRGDRKHWKELHHEYRAVILADAGAGKTARYDASPTDARGAVPELRRCQRNNRPSKLPTARPSRASAAVRRLVLSMALRRASSALRRISSSSRESSLPAR